MAHSPSAESAHEQPPTYREEFEACFNRHEPSVYGAAEARQYLRAEAAASRVLVLTYEGAHYQLAQILKSGRFRLSVVGETGTAWPRITNEDRVIDLALQEVLDKAELVTDTRALLGFLELESRLGAESASG